MGRTVKEFGRLDAAANFAGVLAWEHLNKIQDETEANWGFHVNFNAKGVLLCLGAGGAACDSRCKYCEWTSHCPSFSY